VSTFDPDNTTPVGRTGPHGTYPNDDEQAIRLARTVRFLPAPALDGFGVPDSLLGPHPEEFYGAVGRVVCLTALLEDRLLALLLAIRRAPRSKYVKKPVSGILKELRGATGSPSWSGFAGYLDKAEKATAFRNDIAHNLWPAQGDGTLFGHRPDRGEDGLLGKSQTMTISMAVIREHIGLLVDLLTTWQTWFTVANAPDRLDVASASRSSGSAVAGSPSRGATADPG